MNGRRLLGETLGEIAGSALDMPGMAAARVHVTSLELDLPIDLRFALEGGVAMLVGDVPLLHMRTDFDPPPSRLRITCTSCPVEALP